MRSRSSTTLPLWDRPRIAWLIAAGALIATIAMGIVHVVALRRSTGALADGRSTIRALHSYNAALEVWRQLAAGSPSDRARASRVRLRDSIVVALRQDLTLLHQQLGNATDRELVGEVLRDLDGAGPSAGAGNELGVRGREAMIVLTGRQDSALVRAVVDHRRSLYVATLLTGFGALVAIALAVPLTWTLVRRPSTHGQGERES